MFFFGCAPCCCTKNEVERNIKAIPANDEPDTVGAVAEEAADLRDDLDAERQAAIVGAPKVVGLADPPAVKVAAEEGVAGKGGVSEGQGSPKGAGSVFSVTLRRGPKDPDWGIDVFDDGEAFEITRIRGDNTPIALHNSNTPEEERLRPGDMIMSVNGVRGDTAKMMSEWKFQIQVVCEIAKPTHYVVHVNKTGPLGIDVIHAHREIGCSLAVDRILDGPGPFTQWNEEHPDQKVQRLDRIIAVDGIQGSPDMLKQALKSRTGTITLTFARIERCDLR